MKKEQFWLVVFLSITLTSGCAFGMGQRRCDNIEIPVRPAVEICIANSSGGAGCFDPITGKEYPKPSILNYVCFDPKLYMQNEEWIKNVLDACRGR